MLDPSTFIGGGLCLMLFDNICNLVSDSLPIIVWVSVGVHIVGVGASLKREMNGRVNPMRRNATSNQPLSKCDRNYN